MFDTSATLLNRLRERPNDEAWRRLVDLYTPFLYGWLRRHSVQEADANDLVQEILTVLLRKLPEFEYDRQRGSFRAWLRTIAANCLGTFWRSRRRHSVATGDSDFASMLKELEDPASGTSRLWNEEHDRFLLHRGLELVRPEFDSSTWKAFCAVVLEGKSAANVAAELATTRNAVYIAKSRVLSRLRQEFDGLTDL